MRQESPGPRMTALFAYGDSAGLLAFLRSRAFLDLFHRSFDAWHVYPASFGTFCSLKFTMLTLTTTPPASLLP